jgi:6-phosphogluconolactonase
MTMPKLRKPVVFLAALAYLLPAAVAQNAKKVDPKGEWIAYIGTYTRQKSKGIYAYNFAPATGKTTPIGLVAESVNPSFLAIHPNQKFVYVANEVDTYESQPTGYISAFAIEPGGQLKALNRVSSKGTGPCHVAFDKTGKWLFVANYNGGSVAAYPVHADGTLGEASAAVQHSGTVALARRQGGPHAHSANISPDNRFVFFTDLGLDQVVSYKLDTAKGTLTPNNPPFAKLAPGSGPRHMAFRPDGKFAYVINEITCTVTVFRYDAAGGTLEELQTISTLPPEGFAGNKSTAEIAVHPNGKFVYGSNRGPDSIAIFAIDANKGTLTAGDRVPTQGKTPRNFAIDPTGVFLFAANQDSDNIVVFRIDQKTGGLTATGDVLDVGAPVCVTFAKVR